MQTLQRPVADRVRSEVDKVVTTVETKIHYATLAALDSLVISKVELANEKNQNVFWTQIRESCIRPRKE